MPIGTATRQERIRVRVEISTVSSRRSPISLLTGSFHWNERPMSPCSMFHIHLRYCACSGRLSPYWFSRERIISWLTGTPRACRFAITVLR